VNWKKIQQRAYSCWLHWLSRPSLVARALRRHGLPPSGNLVLPDLESVRIGVVQMNLDLRSSAADYAAAVARPFVRAVAAGAQLVVFPEDVATHLVGFLPGSDRLAAAGSVSGALEEMGADIRVADIFRYLGPAMRRVYLATFSLLARAAGVWVIAGSAVLPAADGRVFNEAHLFDPEGHLAGRQRKIHLLPMEHDWGLSPGVDLEVFDTPLGRIGMPVCMDATYYETFRALALLGADIVAVPAANPEAYSPDRVRRGVWPRVQESPVYGVHACMVGRFMGLELTGKSAVYAPLELTPAGDGVLAAASQAEAEEVVLADVDVARLRLWRRGWERRLRPDVYRRYLPRLYHDYRRRCGWRRDQDTAAVKPNSAAAGNREGRKGV